MHSFFFKGKLHGKGKITRANKDVEEGNFVEGKIEGSCEMRINNGDYYSGEIINEEFFGIGKRTNNKCC